MATTFLTLNGTPIPLRDVDPDVSALNWIRSLGLTGAKEGCAEGECGACAILVVKQRAVGASDDADSAGTDESASLWTAVNACLVPVGSLAGQEVRTAEGIGSVEDLHPVQREMAVRGGSQCGYCTTGFVCSMAAEYYRPGRCAGRACGTESEQTAQNSVTDSADEVSPPADPEHGPNGFDLHALSGNLCRCTGYRPIRDAAYALGEPGAQDPLAQRIAEPAPAAHSERIEGPNGTFVRPSCLEEALRLLREEPDAAIVAGSTDRGVEVNLRGLRSRLVVGIDRIPQLRELHVGDNAVELGAALTLSEIERGLAGRIPLLDELFEQFASRLIRNSATLGGNLGTGSPIGDSPPALLALGAQLVLADADGERTVDLADYFTGYRQSVRRADELIRSVRIPLPVAGLTAFHKIAKRRFDDISSVAVAFALDIEDGVVRSARIGLGGVAATPIRALDCESALTGKSWSHEVVDEAAQALGSAGTPMDDHRASSAYRSAMLGTALKKLYAQHRVLKETA